MVKTLSDSAWFDAELETVIVAISEKVTITLTLEEFSHLLFTFEEARGALLDLPNIKAGSYECDGKEIEELVLIDDEDEYN